MIDLTGCISIPLLKKEVFTGSDCHNTKRYMLRKKETEDKTDLEALVWPGPFAYDFTDEEKKTAQQFSFTKEGIAQAIQWINEQEISGNSVF